MNLAIALGEDPLPELTSEEESHPAPKRKQRWGNAFYPYRSREDEVSKPFAPDWADKEPGSCPQLPLKPPGGKP